MYFIFVGLASIIHGSANASGTLSDRESNSTTGTTSTYTEQEQTIPVSPRSTWTSNEEKRQTKTPAKADRCTSPYTCGAVREEGE